MSVRDIRLRQNIPKLTFTISLLFFSSSSSDPSSTIDSAEPSPCVSPIVAVHNEEFSTPSGISDLIVSTQQSDARSTLQKHMEYFKRLASFISSDSNSNVNLPSKLIVRNRFDQLSTTDSYLNSCLCYAWCDFYLQQIFVTFCVWWYALFSALTIFKMQLNIIYCLICDSMYITTGYLNLLFNLALFYSSKLWSITRASNIQSCPASNR